MPVAVHLVDIAQVVQGRRGGSHDVAPAVVPPVLRQLVALAGARDELPEPRRVRAGVGHRIEGALDHRQQRELGGQAAFLDFLWNRYRRLRSKTRLR